MKTATSTSPPTGPRAVLLIGPPGGGKTTFALQFPNLYFISCDDNMQGPDTFLRKGVPDPAVAAKRIGGHFPQLSYRWDTVNFKDDGSVVPAHECFDRLMDLLLTAKVHPDFKDIEWVCVDPLTMVNEYIRQKVMKLQNRTSMEGRDWDGFKTNLLNLICGRIRGLGKNTILTIHETPEWENSKTDMMQKTVRALNPTIQGGLADFFTGFFTDAWRLSSEPGGANRQKFFMETGKTALSELKNSIGLPFRIEEPTYAKVEPYLKGLK